MQLEPKDIPSLETECHRCWLAKRDGRKCEYCIEGMSPSELGESVLRFLLTYTNIKLKVKL
jgi:methionyl-tRNA synthetase